MTINREHRLKTTDYILPTNLQENEGRKLIGDGIGNAARPTPRLGFETQICSTTPEPGSNLGLIIHIPLLRAELYARYAFAASHPKAKKPP